jgi:predicted membrane-bound mannosyltransferase
VEQSALNKPLNLVKLDWEKALYIVFIILALCTRLWGLGDRVQSHDESIHTKYSWNLYAGHGFQHNPLMHGPFLFHVTALSYFLFSDNDFTARLPVALLGVALVLFPYLLRRWLGRAGALTTSFFLLISPSIAYYSRYIRHDIPIILWSLIAVFAIFSYLRDGRKRWLYLMAAGISLMFATKEVAFIYSAIFGFFLIGLLIIRALEREWPNKTLKTPYIVALVTAAVGLLIVGSASGVEWLFQALSKELAVPIWWDVVGYAAIGAGLFAAGPLLLIGHLHRVDIKFPSLVIGLMVTVVVVGILFRLGLPLLASYASCTQQLPGPNVEQMTGQEKKIALRQHREQLQFCTQQALQGFVWPEGAIIGGVYVNVSLVVACLPFASALLLGLAWIAITALRHYRSFDLIILLGSFCLPLLSPFLIKLANLDPIDYATPAQFYSGAILIEVCLASVAIGLMWDLRRQMEGKDSFCWLIAAAIYYAIFVVLFTTVLTNGYGIPSGLVGSLGYWMKQQEVERGGQPQYYYIIMTLFYEYLPLLLALITPIYLLIRSVSLLLRSKADRLGNSPALKESFIPFTLWWAALSWLGYSIAGERMPWLTVHLALPMILLSGWLVGRLIEGTDWRQVFRRRVWLLALVFPPFVVALSLFIGAISTGAFQGHDLAHLQTTGQLLNGLVGMLMSGAAGYLIWRKSDWRTAVRILLLVALLLPVLLTIRTAWRFCYVNDEYPTELLVYAHAAPGVKEAMQQIDALSRRIAGGAKQIEVAYGSDGSTLFYWQLRDYPNAVFYGENPSREQMELPVIIAGRDQWDDVAPYLDDNLYTVNTYPFLWWPMQDYFHLSPARITHAITDTRMSAALWDIWYNRDYRKYDEVTGKTHTLDEWPLRNEFRLYIRRDVAAQMWDLGTTSPEAIPPAVDPYAEDWREMVARQVFGSTGTETGQFQNPRGITVGPDGFVYVADAGNHRIQKVTADGEFVAAWGKESSIATEAGTPQGFLEPWDVAIGSDGVIYVADTWNHRIQRLDAQGNLINFWGLRGEYGPGDPAGMIARSTSPTRGTDAYKSLIEMATFCVNGPLPDGTPTTGKKSPTWR